MSNKIDISGKKFGRWTVLSESPIRRGCGIVMWNCICDCGVERIVRGCQLKGGTSSSCGCYKKEKAIDHIIHGNSRREGNTGEYRSWQAMKARCTNPNFIQYEDYGGRGITVCDRWLNSFESFLKDIGTKPSSRHSLDRIDVNGNYEPGNCNWATKSEQNSNTRTNHFLEYRGERMILKRWAERLGVNPSSIYLHLKKGKSVETVIEHFLNKKVAA